MVEDSKKRGRGVQRAGHTPATKGRQSHGGAILSADQDAFAAFTAKYRDMLRFADAAEAEAVYSMVSLTQAGRVQGEWQATNPADIKGPVIEVAGSRAVKRRPIQLAVPASSACSEGGRSDSSAKSAPGPPPYLQQQEQWQSLHHVPNMPAAALGPPACTRQGQAARYQQHVHQQAAAPAAGAGAMAAGPTAGDIHPGALGPPTAVVGSGPFFPPGCPPVCGPGPFMPFMAPWGMMPAAMMQQMMFGGLPMPPLPVLPGGMLPPPFLPGGMMMPPPVVQQGLSSAPGTAAEPAAGIPVSGPLPPAGNAFKAAAAAAAAVPPSNSQGTNAQAVAAAAPEHLPAQAGPATPAAATAVTAAAAPKSSSRPAAQQQCEAARPTAAAAADNQAVVASGPGAAAAACAVPPAGAVSSVACDGVLSELEAFDVSALRTWVVSHFCEDVYLLLLDAWRPNSPLVREAIWSWKLHVKRAQVSGECPDYRAFLVSLFGLDKLTELTAAHAARHGSSSLTNTPSCAGAQQQDVPPAAAAAAAVRECSPTNTAAVLLQKCGDDDCAAALAAAVCGAGAAGEADELVLKPDHDPTMCAAECETTLGTTSNLSSEPGAASLSAPGPHVMSLLLPLSHQGGSATSPHRAQPASQPLLH